MGMTTEIMFPADETETQTEKHIHSSIDWNMSHAANYKLPVNS